MPIFNNQITFIHIPKTGGTSIENWLTNSGLKMSLFATDGTYINKHSPQHSSLIEIEKLGLLTEKIFTIIRPEKDRVVSEYFYLKKIKSDLSQLFHDFDSFLDIFLNDKNFSLFDYHNAPNKHFIINSEKKIDTRIKIIDFFDISEIEKYVDKTGLSNFHSHQTDKKDFLLTQEQKIRIKNFYENQ